MNIPKREIFLAAVLLSLAFCVLNVFWLGSFSTAIVFKLPPQSSTAACPVRVGLKSYTNGARRKPAIKRANPHTQIKNQ